MLPDGTPDGSDCRLLPASGHLRIVCDPSATFSLSVSGKSFNVQQITIENNAIQRGKNVNAFEVRAGFWLWLTWPIQPPHGGKRQVMLEQNGSMTSMSSQVLAKSRVPDSWEARGSGCCVWIRIQSQRRLVGIGHYKVHNRKNPHNYNYLSFAYAMDSHKYDIVAMSSPFCFALPNFAHFDNPPIPECPYITLVYSISKFNRTHIIMGVGSNDCNAYLMYVPKSSVESWFA